MTRPAALTHDLPSSTQMLQKVGAEMVGTFALVFAGCGAMMIDTITGGTISHIGVGLTFGLVIMVMVSATGHVSGAHLNPAVTLAFAATGSFPWREVPGYLAGQIFAAVLASFFLLAILGNVADLGATSPVGAHVQSFALEVVLTFFLMFVITAVATDARAVGQMAAWAIGGTVAVGSIFGGPISGASMNPARSIGPALVSGQPLEELLIYLAAPILGALAGAATYAAIRCGGARKSARGCC